MANREIKSLDQLMDGGVSEQFTSELQRIWTNMFDPNTNPKTKREITLKIGFVPNKNRDAAEMTASVTSKLAAREPLSQTVMMMQHDDGSVTVTEQTRQIAGQIDISGQVVIPKVMEFSGAKAAGK